MRKYRLYNQQNKSRINEMKSKKYNKMSVELRSKRIERYRVNPSPARKMQRIYYNNNPTRQMAIRRRSLLRYGRRKREMDENNRLWIRNNHLHRQNYLAALYLLNKRLLGIQTKQLACHEGKLKIKLSTNIFYYMSSVYSMYKK